MAEPEPEPMERRLSHVQDLARQFSRTSLHSTRGKPILIPDLNDLSSPLNPNGDKFNARAWASNIAKVASERGQSFRQLGICFQNLNVHGYGTPTDFQKDVANVWVALPAMIRGLFSSTAGKTKINILSQFDGLVRPGEMCVVLGPPGSGCSTLLKTLAGNTDGFIVDENSYINYQGISPKEMHSAHLGDAIYTAEVDVHFPQLTVGETLSFASHARCQRELPLGLSRDQYCKHLRDVVMAMYGISHTINTKVGDNFVRGVSGGERKRVTIAEATLANAPFQCWDNSTRGLDSSNALEFIKTLRLQSDLFSQTSLVSIYQSPQAAYSLFDKITLLYSGHQIYFGPIASAKEYFESLGFICPPRQTTPDFLTSMTFPSERLIRPDFHPPSTPEEFVSAWKSSPQYAELQQSILEYKSQFPINGPSASIFRTVKQTQKSSGKRRQNSPYILTYTQQILLCIWRSYRRFKSDPIPTLSILFGNTIMALIMSSLFYNLPTTTQSFYGRTVVLFMAILFNAFASVLELMTLYAHRPIVEKQSRLYGFYRGSAEAVASVVVELPVKLVGCLSFNLVFYFMTNLNRGDGAGNFWFYLGVVFLVVLGMSGVFRFIGSLSRTESQAMVPASVLMIALLVFAGFIVPIDYMLPWCRWINYLDPIAYGYEALVINEFHGRNFTCASHIPDYLTADPKNVACDAVGAVAGQNWVSGDAYIKSAFSYIPSHKWRNVGILIAMVIFNHVAHFVTAEYVTAKKSKGEVLVFRQGFVPTRKTNDVEASSSGRDTAILDRPGADKGKSNFQGSTSVFHWNNVCYNIKIKGKTRRILNNIDGWIKPGTLTALMGASGAGKTTLLDCLADRRGGVGVITGEMLVNGKLRDESFQRKTGYAQQQDLHLDTSTVREALTFSALLRQPASAPKNEKLAYVNEVIKMLDMEEYADAVVGILGEGLNVEQRKRLTIGVELVAKPPLLLFVDEPTSGLDSQTSWAILDLLEKLSKAGQSILCTIHQPSAMLFQRFDRLLLLAEGGKTVYFGDIGPNSSTLISYFERNGALRCPPETNPAEWMLQITSSPSPTKLDWPTLWRLSPEYTSIQTELTRLRTLPTPSQSLVSHHSEFALPLHKQLPLVLTRTFTHLNRSPSYIYPKLLLSLLTSLFIGLVFFNSPLTIQALQNQSFAIFELLAITNQLIDQQLPSFITQRQLYEIRERPAKTYSWVIFMLSQILAEIPWYIICSVIIYVCFYFPIGLYNHATEANQQTERGILMYLLFLQFTIWVSTFTHLCASFSETITDAGNAANFLFVFAFFFCGVLRSPNQMPKVWIWLYRASPLSYWVSAVLSVGLGNSKVTCAENELVKFFAPEGESCEGYMKEYMERIGGYLLSGEGNECRYCRVAETNVFLKGISAEYGTRWRNFGIVWVYVLFNVLAACGFYWLVRIPKGRKRV
ncbi:ATP-binding cassette transporter [Podospora fimiseda]|uniref:ATP-binding cassette transporter n=1 Tax=Podospora fimiseda TaxID=252190 RepID=A0AAN7H8B8_9PEZI|nr:ATP-binding cassette transporter [Podospora fimiseda]